MLESLQVSLGTAELDVAAILQQQRIMLQGVPLGEGRIVFTASQFGSFLRHPLMTQAAAAAVQVSKRNEWFCCHDTKFGLERNTRHQKP